MVNKEYWQVTKRTGRAGCALRDGIVPQGFRAASSTIEAFGSPTMHARTFSLIALILLMAGFFALNVDEFTKVNTLNLGLSSVQLPLGLLMLLLLGLVTVIFLANTLYIQSKNMLETRTLTRELSTQRDLADKAEASRFTELRSFLEAQAQEEQQRQVAISKEQEERFQAQEQVLLTRIEQLDKTMSAYFGEFEDRMMRASSFAPSDKI
jgi:hypothetical protein